MPTNSPFHRSESAGWTILVCPACGDWHDRSAYQGCGVECESVEVVPVAERDRYRETLEYVATWNPESHPEDGWRMQAAAQEALDG